MANEYILGKLLLDPTLTFDEAEREAIARSSPPEPPPTKPDLLAPDRPRPAPLPPTTRPGDEKSGSR